MMLSMGIVLSISRDSNRPMKEEQVKSVIKRLPGNPVVFFDFHN